MKGITDKRDITCADLPYLVARAAVVMLLFFICTILMTVQADAAGRIQEMKKRCRSGCF